MFRKTITTRFFFFYFTRVSRDIFFILLRKQCIRNRRSMSERRFEFVRAAIQFFRHRRSFFRYMVLHGFNDARALSTHVIYDTGLGRERVGASPKLNKSHDFLGNHGEHRAIHADEDITLLYTRIWNWYFSASSLSSRPIATPPPLNNRLVIALSNWRSNVLYKELHRHKLRRGTSQKKIKREMSSLVFGIN